MAAEKIQQGDKLDQQIFALIYQVAISVQERQPSLRRYSHALFQQVQLKQDPGIGYVQLKRAGHGFQCLGRVALFVEINESEVAVDGRQRGLGLPRALPAGRGFGHLPFVVPEISEIKVGATIMRICFESRLERQDAVKAVGKTTVR